MQFVFNGTLDELKNTIRTRAKEFGKEMIIYHNKPNTLEIGFQRVGHNDGRFYIANIRQTDSSVVLDGEIADVSSGKQKTKLQAFLSALGGFTLLYLMMELILQIIWLPIFQFSNIWIPLLLPLPVLVFCRILANRQIQKADAEFIAFMAAFTAKYCTYLTEYIDEGCCYDLQMILGGCIKESALPEISIDKTHLSEHCSKCKNTSR